MLAMKRSYASLLESYLKTFPCVALLGVRQCGKTTLLQTLPARWKHFDLERRADHAVISRDPDAFYRVNPREVAMDEAQVSAEILPAEVDLVVDGNFGRVAVEIKHTSAVNGRDLRSLRDFVTGHKARLGVVINNDVMARRYEEDLIGLPFTWL